MGRVRASEVHEIILNMIFEGEVFLIFLGHDGLVPVSESAVE